MSPLSAQHSKLYTSYIQQAQKHYNVAHTGIEKLPNSNYASLGLTYLKLTFQIWADITEFSIYFFLGIHLCKDLQQFFDYLGPPKKQTSTSDGNACMKGVLYQMQRHAYYVMLFCGMPQLTRNKKNMQNETYLIRVYYVI